jgi:putative ABC transport system ATP-binding protein
MPPWFSADDFIVMSSSVIAASARSITKSFGVGNAKVKVLHGIDLDAYESEILMLLGPSGCGKTTLISILAGTLTPDEGELDVLGEPLHRMKKSAITRFRAQQVGFIFQQFNLIPTITCEENAAVPLLIQGMSLSKALPHARKSLEQVGLTDHMKKRPNQLSGGQQQRVAIARALVHNPRLIICDEPTAALDAENGQRVMELFRDLMRQPGRCAIVVTHDHRILRYSDRIATMNDGRIVESVPTSQFDFDHHR